MRCTMSMTNVLAILAMGVLATAEPDLQRWKRPVDLAECMGELCREDQEAQPLPDGACVCRCKNICTLGLVINQETCNCDRQTCDGTVCGDSQVLNMLTCDCDPKQKCPSACGDGMYPNLVTCRCEICNVPCPGDVGTLNMTTCICEPHVPELCVRTCKEGEVIIQEPCSCECRRQCAAYHILDNSTCTCNVDPIRVRYDKFANTMVSSEKETLGESTNFIAAFTECAHNPSCGMLQESNTGRYFFKDALSKNFPGNVVNDTTHMLYRKQFINPSSSMTNNLRSVVHYFSFNTTIYPGHPDLDRHVEPKQYTTFSICKDTCSDRPFCQFFIWTGPESTPCCYIGRDNASKAALPTTSGNITTEGTLYQKQVLETPKQCGEYPGFSLHQDGRFDHSAMCLRTSTTKKTYDQAKAECAGFGAKLVMTKTRATLNFLGRVLPYDVRKNSGHWVGLDDREEEGKFVWGDGSVLALDSDLWSQTRAEYHLDQHDSRDCVHTWTSQGVHSLSDTGCTSNDVRTIVCQLETTVGTSKGRFPCANNLTVSIPNDQLCNGVDDCNDGGTDENPGFCREYSCWEGSMKCPDGVTCISSEGICDGQPQCQDGWDEQRCTSYVCPFDSLRCQYDEQCFHKRRGCDFEPNCEDGTDEEDSFCENFTCFGEGKVKCARNNKCMDKDDCDWLDDPSLRLTLVDKAVYQPLTDSYDITLKCETVPLVAQDAFIYDVIWQIPTKNGVLLNDTRLDGGYSTLKLNVDSMHSGNYTCTLRNRFDSMQLDIATANLSMRTCFIETMKLNAEVSQMKQKMEELKMERINQTVEMTKSTNISVLNAQTLSVMKIGISNNSNQMNETKALLVDQKEKIANFSQRFEENIENLKIRSVNEYLKLNDIDDKVENNKNQLDGRMDTIEGKIDTILSRMDYNSNCASTISTVPTTSTSSDPTTTTSYEPTTTTATEPTTPTTASALNASAFCESLQYETDSSPWRAVSNKQPPRRCDKDLHGWYRFTLNGQDANIVTSCVDRYHCGTISPMWLDLEGGSLPQPGEGKQVKACASNAERPLHPTGCCQESLYITVRNCGSFYIYFINGTPAGCNLAYCTQD